VGEVLDWGMAFVWDERRKAMLVLNALPHIGPVTVARWMARFGPEVETWWGRSAAELSAVGGVGPVMARTLRRWQEHVDLEREEALLEAHGVRFVCWFDDDYPAPLREIADPPIGLYVKGGLDWPRPVIAVVGTRQPSPHGRALARRWAEELAEGGATVVSGLARGIDTAAHEGALAVGGVSAAVLGSGIDVLYPRENEALAARLAGRGAVLTEFPFGRPADRQTFPMRNRIVSGLADLVVVVETDRGGGSLITARMAAEQGRTVCAVPGRVDARTSRGCHALIRDGATLVTSVAEVLAELRPGRQEELDLSEAAAGDCAAAPDLLARAAAAGLTAVERALLERLAAGTRLRPDALAEALDRPIAEVHSGLLVLELHHLARRGLDGSYEAAE